MIVSQSHAVFRTKCCPKMSGSRVGIFFSEVDRHNVVINIQIGNSFANFWVGFEIRVADEMINKTEEDHNE
jgi:hypothetical protein